MPQNTIIKLRSISKRYGYGDAESFALKDFDLTIQRGEFIMLMGPSGCGKTTLLNILGLLDRASSGEYFLNGESVANISSARQARLRAKKIGFIFQDFDLIDDIPVIENVALPLVYAGHPKTARLKAASALLARFNLQKREYYYPHQLSGGQQQHVAIARAIVGHPEIILADEPTGNLDSHASKNVMDMLKSIHAEGNTIIMVTHNPALTAYATRVIHMLDGQIDTDIKTVADWKLPRPIATAPEQHLPEQHLPDQYSPEQHLPEAPKLPKTITTPESAEDENLPASPKESDPTKPSETFTIPEPPELTKTDKPPKSSESPELPESPKSSKSPQPPEPPKILLLPSESDLPTLPSRAPDDPSQPPVKPLQLPELKQLKQLKQFKPSPTALRRKPKKRKKKSKKRRRR